MGDLKWQSAELPVGITGLDSTGASTNLVNADANGSLYAITPDAISNTTALGALNAVISLDIHGQTSVGLQLAAGTFIGTITPYCSLDGGATYVPCFFYKNGGTTVLSSYTFSSANTLTALSVLPAAGSGLIQIQVTAYTSGTMNALLRASQISAPPLNVGVNILGLNNMQTSQYSVGITAVQITPTPLSTRSSVGLKVTTTTNTDVVYIGASNAVTTSNGYPLFNGDTVQLDITPSGTVWAIGTSAGQTLYAIEVGS